MGSLEGMTVVVSGVGPGLGLEVSKAVLDAGGHVVAADLVGDRLAGLLAQIDPGGKRSLAVRADIGSAEDCARVAEASLERFGRVDGLVNVAAIDSTSIGGLELGNLDDWDRAANVNVKGTMRITRELLPSLKERGGSVVMIGSNITAKARPANLMLSYAMSKGALVTGTQFLARELGPAGIRVNLVSPGWKWGPALEAHFESRAEQEGTSVEALVASTAADLALRRLTSDADLAQVVIFFLSEQSRALTGQTVYADGGDVFV